MTAKNITPARRGRPPKGNFINKSQTLTTRITPKLKKALEKAAKENGRSVSQETELRLRNSFDTSLQNNTPHSQLIETMGGEKSFALLRLMGFIISHIQECMGKTWDEDKDTNWHIRLALPAIYNWLSPFSDEFNDGYKPENMSIGYAAAGDVCMALIIGPGNDSLIQDKQLEDHEIRSITKFRELLPKTVRNARKHFSDEFIKSVVKNAIDELDTEEKAHEKTTKRNR